VAQSFWSKRHQASNFAQSGANNARVWVVTLVGIFLVGLLMYGVFTSSRWAYSRLTGPDSPVASTQNTPDEEPVAGSTQAQTPTAPTTTAPSTSPVTITSSTTTRTPQTTSQSTSSTLPNTGPGNWGALFVVSSSLAYVVYRRKLTRSR